MSPRASPSPFWLSFDSSDSVRSKRRSCDSLDLGLSRNSNTPFEREQGPMAPCGGVGQAAGKLRPLTSDYDLAPSYESVERALLRDRHHGRVLWVRRLCARLPAPRPRLRLRDGEALPDGRRAPQRLLARHQGLHA